MGFQHGHFWGSSGFMIYYGYTFRFTAADQGARLRIYDSLQTRLIQSTTHNLTLDPDSSDLTTLSKDTNR